MSFGKRCMTEIGMSMKITSLCAGVAFILSGCAAHTWAPGPNASMPFEQASGHCKLAAMSGQRSFVAVGSASYVAGASIGNGIGNVIRENQIYNACMEA